MEIKLKNMGRVGVIAVMIGFLVLNGSFMIEQPIRGIFTPRSYSKSYRFLDIYTEYDIKDKTKASKILKYIEEGDTTFTIQNIHLAKLDSIIFTPQQDSIEQRVYWLFLKEKKIIKVRHGLSFYYIRRKENRLSKFAAMYIDKIIFHH